jgi:hypothetical protein
LTNYSSSQFSLFTCSFYLTLLPSAFHQWIFIDEYYGKEAGPAAELLVTGITDDLEAKTAEDAPSPGSDS